MKKFTKLSESKLSGKELEFGKPYAEWTEAEKTKGLLHMAVDGFNLNLGPDKLQRLSKEEIIKKCEEFSEWLNKFKEI